MITGSTLRAASPQNVARLARWLGIDTAGKSARYVANLVRSKLARMRRP